MRTLARWCFQHRWIVLLGWIVAFAGLTVIHGAAGSGYKDEFKLSGTDSFDALNLLQKSAPKASGDQEQLVVAVKDGKLTDPQAKARVETVLNAVGKMPHVASVASPFDAGNEAQVSKDGRIAFATVTLDEDVVGVPIEATKDIVDKVQSFSEDGLQVEIGGQAIEQERQQESGMGGTAIGFLAALAVLLVVFGSFLAAILPLLTAAFALGVGIAAIGLLSHALTMASWSSQLSLLIGLGVGVDYALFIVTRYRQEIMRGETPEDAAVNALDTSGRAVLFAGITVCIALLGMFALGVSFLYGVATAASIVVAFTVLAALTLLPAFLALFGKRVLTGKQRRAVAAGELATHRRVARLGAMGRHPAEAAGRSRPLGDGPHAAARRARAVDAPRLVGRRQRPRRTRRRSRPMTCSQRASGRASTGRCSSSPRSRTTPARRPSRGWSTPCATPTASSRRASR